MPFIVKSLRRESDKAPIDGLFDVLIQTVERTFFLKPMGHYTIFRVLVVTTLSHPNWGEALILLPSKLKYRADSHNEPGDSTSQT